MTGTLFLIPSDLGGDNPDGYLPRETQAKLLSLEHFVVEEAKTARRFLAALGRSGLREIHMATLNEHTPATGLSELLSPLRQGFDVGLLSEAGCPAVADPGADLVALAHREGIKVVPMVGPSSILLALMASGLGGQRFAFHGYLPVEPAARQETLRSLEHESAQARMTQLFIETPYRNQALWGDILATCAATTLLCVASDLTQASESVATRSIADWRQRVVDLDRRPTVFALSAPSAPPARHSAIAAAPATRPRQNAGPRARRSSRGT
ncbi:MAG: SAM-dependent methyltransferase [Burkholderiales bacterium]